MLGKEAGLDRVANRALRTAWLVAIAAVMPVGSRFGSRWIRGIAPRRLAERMHAEGIRGATKLECLLRHTKCCQAAQAHCQTAVGEQLVPRHVIAVRPVINKDEKFGRRVQAKLAQHIPHIVKSILIPHIAKDLVIKHGRTREPALCREAVRALLQRNTDL